MEFVSKENICKQLLKTNNYFKHSKLFVSPNRVFFFVVLLLPFHFASNLSYVIAVLLFSLLTPTFLSSMICLLLFHLCCVQSISFVGFFFSSFLVLSSFFFFLSSFSLTYSNNFLTLFFFFFSFAFCLDFLLGLLLYVVFVSDPFLSLII